MILQNNNIERKRYIFSNDLLKEYNNYSKYLNHLDISQETKEWRLKHLRAFLADLEKKKIKIKDLNPNNVYDYLSSLSDYSARTKEHRAVCTRLFLNWCYDNKKTRFNGNKVLPLIKCNKEEKTISYYSNEEITKIINTIDVNSKNGKRNLSIILIFSYLGLRANDVKNLKLKDIRWNENKIVLVHSKNNAINSFIMPNNLRYAILDYLKNERTDSNSEFVFLNKNNNQLGSSSIYNIVDKCIKKAQIDTTDRRHGPHSLRHSIATTLLNDNYSIYEIANVLGHKNINNTKIYAKVDLVNLKKLSLEVPEWKN